MIPDLTKFAGVFNQASISTKEIPLYYVLRSNENGVLENQIEESIVQRRFSRIFLVGARGSGKTSFNRYILARIKEKSNLIPIVISQDKAPESVNSPLFDFLAEIRKLIREGRVRYAGKENLGRLLLEQRSPSKQIENLRELVTRSSGVYRILLIVDEFDKGAPEKASKVLAELQDALNKISSNIDLLVTLSPITYNRALDGALRIQFQRFDIPPVDEKTISDIIQKRINAIGDLNSNSIKNTDIIDEDAQDLVFTLSMGILRRAFYFISASLLVAQKKGLSRVTAVAVEDCLKDDLKKARNFYNSTTQGEKEVIKAILDKKWGKAVEHSKILSDLIDRRGYVIELSDESCPFTISPELARVTHAKPRIYLASTCHDFRDLRAEVSYSLRNWGYQPYLNENSDFPVPSGVDSYQACVETVKQSDCLVLVIGTRYGGEVKNLGISITELEYQTARKIGIPRINFCLDFVWNQIQLVRENPEMKYPSFFTERREKITKIFRFLDDVRKYESAKTDNWVYQFKDSVELKRILRRQLKSTVPTSSKR
ncbi:MAG: DUF4062 domain-containing protein [Candidatus Bathyarchaeia archaeon]